MAILDVFSTPMPLQRSVEAVSNRLTATPAWIEVVANIKALYEAGILVHPESAVSVRRTHASRFDSAPVHVKMLNDKVRTSRFQLAITRSVKPGDVVVDIGTGTGVLAITAALAGARHVYALEATAMSRAAQAMIDANGLTDRVTVIDSHSFDVELPEKADVLISEIIGDDPLGERILPTFADARRRFLADHAVAIPAALQIRALPVEVPPESLERLAFTPTRAEVWAKLYGFAFDGLVATFLEHDHSVKVNSYETRGWTRLAPALTVANLDLLEADSDIIDSAVQFGASRDGSISGMLVFFEADLGAGVWLSIHPDDAAVTNSWGSVLQLFARPFEVVAGDELRLFYHFDDRGSRVEVRPI